MIVPIRKAAAVTVGILLAAACYMQITAAYAGDKAWLLFAARRWLGGHRLYVDIVEVNPPLIVWLYALPVWLFQHSGLADDRWLGMLGLGGCGLSVWLSARLIRLHPAFAEHPAHRRAFALLLFALFVFFTTPTYFFDREHILLVLTFPYILRFMPSLAGARVSWPLRLSIGLCAAVGFCIKPYTLTVFGAMQSAVMLRTRSGAVLISLENSAIYLCAALYLLCIWIFTPEYVDSILPMALATYGAFSRRLMGLFYGIFAFIVAGVSFVDFRSRDRSPYQNDILYFTAIAGGYLLYALCNNGWGYTYHPLICMLLFISAGLYVHYRWLADHDGTVRRFTFGARACALVLALNAFYMLYYVGNFFLTPTCAWSNECAKNLAYAAYLREHDVHSFGALTEDFHKWPALSRMTGIPLETRYNALWMVPGLMENAGRDARRNAGITLEVGQGLADDLDRRKPEILFVDDARNFFGTGRALFLPDFFAAVPAFARAWSHYSYVAAIDNCPTGKPPAGCRHTLYRRLP